MGVGSGGKVLWRSKGASGGMHPICIFPKMGEPFPGKCIPF